MKNWVLFLCLLCSTVAHAFAADEVLDASLARADPISLTQYLGVLEDPDKSLSLADLQRPEIASRFKTDPTPAAALSLGYSRSAFWVRLTLRNDSDHALDQLLELSYPRLSSVEFFQSGSGDARPVWVTGNALPFASRAYPSRFFVFPVSLPARAVSTFYFRIQSTNSILVPVKLWTQAAFHAYERDDYLAQAWYFGMASTMVLFNLLLFFALRDSIYLPYVAFVSCSSLVVASLNGLASEFLWPSASWWSDIAYYVSTSVAIVVLIVFMRAMLRTKRTIPRIDYALKLLMGAHLLALPVYAVALQAFSKAAAILNLVTIVFIFGVGVLCSVKRQRSAYFFVAAFAMLMIGGVMTALRSLGLLPTSVLSVYGLQFGSAFEMILLALALADRINVIRQEKVKAQNDALEAEQRVVETLRTSERLLESKVSERTAELTATIDNLTQTRAMLVQVEKLASLGALVAGVAHELNTPIGNALTTASAMEGAAINLKASLVAGKLLKSNLIQYVETAVPMAELVMRSCERAANLINSFKQVAVDQTSEQRRAFDLRVLVDDNIAALQPSFKHAPWIINVDIAPNINIDTYPGPLGQIITNLVNNAVIHGFANRPQGTLTISATLHNHRVSMHFVDDGAGMDASVLARIFEPFFTTRLGQGGCGLGLSISHNIATGVLGGSLFATSETGKGSTFHLSFPVKAPK